MEQHKSEAKLASRETRTESREPAVESREPNFQIDHLDMAARSLPESSLLGGAALQRCD